MAVVAVYKLNLELKSVFVENKNGMGSAISYIIAKTILVTPILFLFSIASLGVPGFIIQRFPPSTFGKLILLFTAQIAMWESSGEAFAALFDEAVVGMLVHTTLWFAALLFSGYLVPLSDVSAWDLLLACEPCMLGLTCVLLSYVLLDVLATEVILDRKSVV